MDHEKKTHDKAADPDKAQQQLAAEAVAHAGKADPKVRVTAAPGKAGADATTLTQKVVTITLLIVITLVLGWLGKGAISGVEQAYQHESRASWSAPAGVLLRSGPPAFWYDAGKGEVVHLGVVDKERKTELAGLLTLDDNVGAEVVGAYRAAVDQLAFESNKRVADMIISVLWLGGLAGVLGVQLRSLVNFVGLACYKQALNLGVWWPYYIVRPFTGFVLGVVIVMVTQAGFLLVESGPPSGTMWWAGIAFLAGYGEQEFTQRLRQLSKAFFGEEARKPERDSSSNPART